MGERREGGITHKSLGLAYPDLGQPESAGRIDHTPLLGAASNIKLLLGHSNSMTNTL